MSRTVRIDPADPRPIWRQIEESVRHLVASGALAAGATVPSVRDLARDLLVNPATVSKAYQRLTDAGVLTVRRGEGTYVSDSPPELPTAERSRRLLQGALRYASLAVTIGAARSEAGETLEEAWQSLSSGGGTHDPETPEDTEKGEEWTSSRSRT
jgi:GntR family transcriptional regulator